MATGGPAFAHRLPPIRATDLGAPRDAIDQFLVCLLEKVLTSLGLSPRALPAIVARLRAAGVIVALPEGCDAESLCCSAFGRDVVTAEFAAILEATVRGPTWSVQGALVPVGAPHVALVSETPGASRWRELFLANAFRFEREFEMVGLVGRGGFGKVFSVRNRLDGGIYAIKRVRLCTLGDMQRLTGRFRNVIKEATALARLEHHHVVRYFHSWVELVPYEESDDSAARRMRRRRRRRRMAARRASREADDEKHLPPSPLSSLSPPSSLHVVVVEECSDEETTGGEGATLRQGGDCDCESDSASDESMSESDLSSSAFSASSVSASSASQRALALRTVPTSLVATQRPTHVLFLNIQMELCGTRSLKDWLDAKPCAPGLRVGLELARGIASGLEHIHEAMLIHRDLKPANIFLSATGQPKIGDLGLAKDLTGAAPSPFSPTVAEEDGYSSYSSDESAASGDDEHTRGVGTVHYAAPEVATGRYSAKADIWSLGLILLEIFSRPFGTRMERIMALQAAREGKPPGDCDIPPVILHIVRTMVQRDASRRPDAGQVRTMLDMIDSDSDSDGDAATNGDVETDSSSSSSSSSASSSYSASSDSSGHVRELAAMSSKDKDELIRRQQRELRSLRRRLLRRKRSR